MDALNSDIDEVNFEQARVSGESYRIRMAAGITKSKDDAEECEHNGVTSIWLSYVTEKAGRPVAVYFAMLGTAVRREANEVYRRRKRHKNHEDSLARHLSDRGASDSDRMGEDEIARVRLAIAQLPPKHREVITLKYFQQLKPSEIASILGIPEATVRTRILHGLKKLKDIMGGEGEGEANHD